MDRLLSTIAAARRHSPCRSAARSAARLRSAALALLVLVGAGCSSSTTADPGVELSASRPGCPGVSAKCTLAAPPSYTRDVAPIIARRCSSCHTGVGDAPWSLATYDNLVEWDHVARATLYACTMPPPDAGSPMPEEERQLLWAWFVCGSPAN